VIDPLFCGIVLGRSGLGSISDVVQALQTWAIGASNGLIDLVSERLTGFSRRRAQGR
jgi:hypothetical protein